MYYENQDGLFVKWNGNHIRFDEEEEIPTKSHQELDGIDFAMWECDPTTFTYKDLEVTMVAYNKDCEEKDRLIEELSKKIEILGTQKKKIPKFHNLAEKIDPNYEINGYLNQDTYDKSLKNLREMIQKDPEIEYGDILFIGSSYETRQEYGFAIVQNKKEGRSIGGEDGMSIVLDHNGFESLKYKEAISEMKENHQEIYEMFSYWDTPDEEIESAYQEKNMWE